MTSAMLPAVFLSGLSAAGSTGAKWAALIAVQALLLASLGLAFDRFTRARGFAVRAIALQLAMIALLLAPFGTLLLARRSAPIAPGVATDAARWIVNRSALQTSRVIEKAGRAARAAKTTRAARALRGSALARRVVRPMLAYDWRHAGRVAARTVAGLLVFAWIGGILLSCARLTRGAVTVRALRTRARPGLARWSEPGSTTAVEILFSDEIDIPFAHGVMRPAIIFPATAEGLLHLEPWSAILAHERAHLARRDPLMQWLRQIVVTAHWWNPLVAQLARVTDTAVEGACDDEAIARGAHATTYANAMLALASAGDPLGVQRAVALPFVDASALEQRIRAVLEQRRARRRVGHVDFLLPALVGAALSLLVACATPHPSSFRVSSLWRRSAATFRATSAWRSTPDRSRMQVEMTQRRLRDRELARTKRDVDAAGVRVDERTEALVGLAMLFDDPSAQVRASAREALQQWPRAERRARLSRAALLRSGTTRDQILRALVVDEEAR